MEELKVGDIIKDRYSLVQFLGNGSFGEVWLVHDNFTDRDVTLKIYLSLDPSGIDEFQREYSNSVDIASPFLLTPDYFDVYNRRPFLVMKYCENGSSSKLVGNITEEQLWQFIHDVASGLSVLHSQSDPIVHQDIKPDNVLIDRQGHFLITDFGISKRLRATMRRQSKRDVSSGAMPYMAPERFESNPKLTTASDIWSLGASVYELATGELPFSGFGGSMQRNGAEIPSLNTAISPTINEIMQRCLNPNVLARPSAMELANWANSKRIPEAHIKTDHNTNTLPNNSETIIGRKDNSATTKENSSKSIWSFILIGLGVLICAVFFCRRIMENKIEESSPTVPTSETITEEVGGIQSHTAEQFILESSCAYVNNQKVHFYKGAIYYKSDIYPVMVCFITEGERVTAAIYKNMTYGGRIVMSYQNDEDKVKLSGKDGMNDFVMTLSPDDDQRLLGTAMDGNKTMTVRLMPTSEQFEFSKSANVSFSEFKFGDGKIRIPSFLTYKGESDDGGPMFFDATDQIRLYADYGPNQDLGLFRNWVNEELGSGTTLIYQDNCFVQSGYTQDNEIYYCKAFMDKTTYPQIMYTAIIFYPTSRRNEIDGILAKMFNSFPNIK
jgi:serine/threonine protein kinase